MKTLGTKPLKIGFIGGGLNSAVGYAHRTACGLDGQWELYSGCFSLDPEENLKSGQCYGLPDERIYQDWQLMVTEMKPTLDAVAVLTPTPTHCGIVNSCIEAGIPVICEKSMAMNTSEAKVIQENLTKLKGFLAVTYNYSGYPMVRELRSLIRSGGLGEILHFQAEMPQEGFLRLDSEGNKPMPQEWRLKDQQIPTLHLDLGVHLHHILHYLTGQHPIEVIADHQTFGFFDVVDNLSCLCRYSAGVHGQAWFSKSAIGHRNGLRIRIYGSQASAEWFQGNPEELVLCHGDGRRQIQDRSGDVSEAGEDRYNRFKAGHPAGFVEAFANLYADTAVAVSAYQNGGDWDSDEIFGAGLATEGLAMMEAMVASLESRCWEKVGGKT